MRWPLIRATSHLKGRADSENLLELAKLITRAKAILLTPKTEWSVIAEEPDTIGGITLGYVLPLALVPVLCSFIKTRFIGLGSPVFGTTLRLAPGRAFALAISQYALYLVEVLLIAWLINLLAPTFAGSRNGTQALKTAAYSFTATAIAGIAVFLGSLGMVLAVAAILYGVYLVYLGLPVTMKCPPDRAVSYTVVTLIAAAVVGYLFNLTIGPTLFARGAIGLSGISHSVARTGSDGGAGALAAAAQLAGTLSGQAAVEAIPPERLESFLPETLAGLDRVEIAAQRANVAGLSFGMANARYADAEGKRSIRVQISDMGSAQGLMMLSKFIKIEGERQSTHGNERSYREDGIFIHKLWNNDAQRGEYEFVVADRFMVKFSSIGIDQDALDGAVTRVDMAGLAAL